MVAASAQFGRKKDVHAAGTLGDMGDVPEGGMKNDVDLAMEGWKQLGNNPDKMQELVKGFKDPEVWAKAQEMLKDPEYMAAAKAKLAEMQAKAQANGMLDASGNPVPGALSGTGMEGMMSAMQGMAGSAATAQARDWEMENIEAHKGGTMNAAELGMANLKGAMKDPSVMAEVANMMKDPENMAALKKMMADPTFQRQAQAMAAKMKGDGTLPDFSSPQMQAKMQDVMQRMQNGGMAGMMGGAGAGGDAASELARLRAENAQLKARMQ